MGHLSELIESTLLEKRAALLVERNKACAPWDAKIAEIDAFLRQATSGKIFAPTVVQPPYKEEPSFKDRITARKANKMAVEVAEVVLKERGQMKTGDLWKIVQERGVSLVAENQEERFGQLLSGAKDTFQSDRKNGWTLKSETPTGATNTEGVSSATESDGS